MKIIISPAKKMNIDADSLALETNPVFLDETKILLEWLRTLSYEELKKKVPEERKEALQSWKVVSDDKNASWLIDYWCGKDIRGLIQMPFSRHWIMHTEASLRIKNRIRA